MIGQTISHYRIVEKLGGGGMGVVYKAEDTRLGRFVALKFLPEEVAQDPQALDRFQREARAASALNHPNICTIYEIGEEDGRPFIAMEFLDGMTLKHRIGGTPDGVGAAASPWRSRSPTRSTRRTPRASCIATSSPPTSSSPSAVTPRFSTSDWPRSPSRPAAGSGDADETVAQDSDAQHLTSPGAMLGTVAYMSPEQVRAKELDARTDLFSFGAVLYEMATGKMPFDGASSGEICGAILHQDPTAGIAGQLASLRRDWKRSSTRRWRRTATCATSTLPRCAPTCSG